MIKESESMANILIVEDEKDTNEIIKNFLIADGHKVIQAFDGKSALNEYNDFVELIILDIMLPDINGIQVVEQIRKKNKDVIIIILSAIKDEVTQLISFDKNVDEYVEKPFSPSVLVKRVDLLLKRINGNEKHKEGNCVCINGYEFDFERYMVKYHNQLIHFTVKEMELIKLLYQSRGVVLSRQKILESIWSDEEEVIDRTVDVHIKNIRKKTYEDIIETVKGVGYRIRRMEN